MIEQDPKSAEIIRPLLRGRDIKRYFYDFADLYLLFIPWHFPLHNDPSITGASLKAEKEFENQYPAIYNHLLKYKKELSNRNKAETGIRYEWYALQRWGANYWEDFYKQKIVYQELTQGSSFAFDKNADYFVSNTGYLITGNHLGYILAMLNSKFIEFSFRQFYSISLGEKGLRWLAQYIENLPIVLPTSQTKSQFNKLLETQKYQEIDKLVYEMYDLGEDEITFIEAQ